MIVFFDLDDTLVDSESAHREAITTLIRHYSLTDTDQPGTLLKEWFSITQKYLQFYFERTMTLDEQRISRIREFFSNRNLSLTISEAEQAYNLYHQVYLRECRRFEDAIPCLEKLRPFQPGIISNGTRPDQLFKLRNNRLEVYFEKIIVSDTVLPAKPDPRIFIAAAEAAGAKPAECLYIGNSYETDYLGSTGAGMKAILLDRYNSIDVSGIEKINSLSELTSTPSPFEKKSVLMNNVMPSKGEEKGDCFIIIPAFPSPGGELP
jgi:putative hydrolase of the HAD superfamily